MSGAEATDHGAKLTGYCQVQSEMHLAGHDVVSLVCRYNSYRYGGEKRVVVSTASWLGGRNSFMGTAYLVVGGASLLFALAFLALQSAFPRPLGDESRLSWSTLHAPARSSGLGSAIIS